MNVFSFKMWSKSLALCLVCVIAFWGCGKSNKISENNYIKTMCYASTYIVEEPTLEEENVIYGGDWCRASVNGSTFKMCDGTLQSKWMQKYAAYIKEAAKGDSFDYTKFFLADVDENRVPEVVLGGGCHASANMMLTIYNDRVYSSPQVYFYSYITGGNGLLQCHDTHGGTYDGAVYKMQDGKFVELYKYMIDSITDTEPIKKNLDEVYFSKGKSLRIRSNNTEWYPMDIILK